MREWQKQQEEADALRQQEVSSLSSHELLPRPQALQGGPFVVWLAHSLFGLTCVSKQLN